MDRTRPLLCFIHDVDTVDEPRALWDLDDETWADVDVVQVRGKELADADLESLARGWVERLEGLETRVVVNDRMDVALAAEAHGVHLGPDDVPIDEAREQAVDGFLIGCTARSRDELLIGQAKGADYAGLGAFFQSRTKPGAQVLDPWKEGLMERIPALTIPVFGVGGVRPDRVDDVFRVPLVTGLAVSEAIQAAADPAAAVEGLRKAMSRAWDRRAEVARR